MPRLATPALALVVALLGACGPSTPEPDGSWQVTVTGISTDCTTDTTGFQKTYTYNLFFDGSATEIRIGEDLFATGTISGCSITYETPVWLEERDTGNLRWQIVGEAEYQGSAGGCDITEDYDWYGTESIVVTESEDESILAGCTFEFSVMGNLGAGG